MADDDQSQEQTTELAQRSLTTDVLTHLAEGVGAGLPPAVVLAADKLLSAPAEPEPPKQEVILPPGVEKPE